MDAVTPAAGRGRRLRELTEDRPKGLVDIAGRPLLAYAFESDEGIRIPVLDGLSRWPIPTVGRLGRRPTKARSVRRRA